MNASPFNQNGNGRTAGSHHDGGDGGASVMPGRLGSAGVSDGGGNGMAKVTVPLGPETRTDEQLLDDYRHGDKAAFAGLVNRYQRELYHFLVRFLGNRASAEDVFQESFLQVHQSARKFDLTKSFRPWLFTIAANKARDLMRSRGRRRTISCDVPIERDGNHSLVDNMASPIAGPVDCAETDELRRRIIAVVDGLPPSQREVVLLAYFHQFPYREIAEMLKLPLGTVKSRLHVATRTFAATWGRLNPPVDATVN